MAIRKHANNYSSTLNGAITDVATTLIVTSATGLPAIGAGEEYNLTLDDGAGTIEIVTVTDDASSPTLTVTRGAEGTSNVAWGDLSTIELRPTANSLDRKADGAASSTDNAIARYDSTTGKVLQDSVVIVDDSGNVSGVGTVDGRDLATDGTKLDAIEALADVTDETNVKAALDGATTTGVTPLANDKILLLDDSDSDNLKHALFSEFVPSNSFRATQSAPQSISASTFTKITFDTETWDTNGNFDNATNYRFTPTLAGKYRVSVICGFTLLGSGKTLAVYIYKNGSSYQSTQAAAGGAIGNSIFEVCDSVDMNGSTDYIEGYVLQNDTGNLNTLGASFSAEFIE